MTFKKWFLTLIFLIISFVMMADIIVIAIYVAAKIYLHLIRDIPFGVYLPGFWRLIKGSTIGGIIAGIGCWYIYYKNYGGK